MMGSDGQGGDLNYSWEEQEECLNRWLGLTIDSFGISLVLVWVVSCFREPCCATQQLSLSLIG